MSDKKAFLWSLWKYKDGVYRVSGFSRGAGSLKGKDLIHYEPCYPCEFSEFTRPRNEFEEKFEPFVEDGQDNKSEGDRNG